MFCIIIIIINVTKHISMNTFINYTTILNTWHMYIMTSEDDQIKKKNNKVNSLLIVKMMKSTLNTLIRH